MLTTILLSTILVLIGLCVLAFVFYHAMALVDAAGGFKNLMVAVGVIAGLVLVVSFFV